MSEVNDSSSDTTAIGFHDMVRVAVGKDHNEKVFFVHPKKLAQQSDFFRNALANDWKEAQDRVVALPEDDPDVFSTYLHYLYTGDMCVKPVSEGYTNGNASAMEQDLAVKLYVFADKIQDMWGRDESMKTMAKATTEIRTSGCWYYPRASVIDKVYTSTMPGSPMRRMIVDFFAYYKGDSSFQGYEKVNKDFLFDLSITLMGLRIKPSGKKGPRYCVETYLEKAG